MNYLLYGEDEYLISEEIKKIEKKEQVEDISISHYDLQIDSIKDIIDDCMTISLFEPKKLVIVNNCTYFNRVKNNEDDVNIMLEYLNNFNPDTIFIIINHNSSIDSTKKITKKIKESGKVIELNKASVKSVVSKMFDGYKISSSTIDLFIERVGEDLAILSEEAKKIKLYKIDKKEITNQDIIDCATYSINTDIFKFIDNIINKNKDVALATYYELLKNNEEPLKIIVLLASKFRLMYQACTLSKKNMSEKEIANFLGVHPYPVKLAIQSGLRYPEKILLNFLSQLADLDRDIKTGKIDPELGVELFILRV